MHSQVWPEAHLKFQEPKVYVYILLCSWWHIRITVKRGLCLSKNIQQKCSDTSYLAKRTPRVSEKMAAYWLMSTSIYSFFCLLAAWLCEWHRQSVSRLVHHFGPDWNILTALLWIAMKFYTDVHVPQRMNPDDYDDRLSFTPMPPWGSHLWFWVKCLKNYWVDCHEILNRHSSSPQENVCTSALFASCGTHSVLYMNVFVCQWMYACYLSTDYAGPLFYGCIPVNFHCTFLHILCWEKTFSGGFSLGHNPTDRSGGCFLSPAPKQLLTVCVCMSEIVQGADWKHIPCEWAVHQSPCCRMLGETAGKAVNPQILHDAHIYVGFSHLNRCKAV